MKAEFKITSNDIVLLPFSPVNESDTLEIRVQGYNSGEDGEVSVTFKIDNEVIETKNITVCKNEYGFALCRVSMVGKAGKHIVSVNDVETELTVLSKSLPKLDGGFAMIGPPNDRIPVNSLREDLKSFTDDQWKEYIKRLTEIGCECIIFHNCQEYLIYNNFKPSPGDLTAHYPSKLYPKSDIKADDPIKDVLEVGEEYGIKVFLSVGNCYGHTACDDDFYEMFELYGKYKSFYGWYLSNETNMKVFKPQAWETLKHQAEVIRKISPVKPILISPFEFPSEETIEYIKQNNVFDIMMPQDCVGQGRLNIEESHDMHKKLKSACDEVNKHLWANCEAFNFKDGILVPRYKDGGMYGENGFIAQIQAVRPHVEKIMNFAYTGFFAPTGFTPEVGGKAAVKQFEDYLEYYNKIK